MPIALLLSFILVPLAELYVISRVGSVLGLPATLGVLLLVSVLGAALVKREGLRTWRALRSTMGSGEMPARELANAALVLVGGVLLLTPGFLTDILGLLLVLPPTRAVARRMLTTLALRQARPRARRSRRTTGPTGSGRASGWQAGRPAGRIIEGEVVEGEVREGEVREGQVREGQVREGSPRSRT